MSRHLWTEEDMINFLNWAFIECKEAIKLGDYFKVNHLLMGAAALAVMGLTLQSTDHRINAWLNFRVSQLYCALPKCTGDVIPHISDNERESLMRSLGFLSNFFNGTQKQTAEAGCAQLPEDYDEYMLSTKLKK